MPDNAPKSIFAIFALGAWCAGAEPRIESFSPGGYTKDASQVAVRFSKPMVALGDPDTSDPFAVVCDVPGNGRWIDERNWVYDFAYDVPRRRTLPLHAAPRRPDAGRRTGDRSARTRLSHRGAEHHRRATGKYQQMATADR